MGQCVLLGPSECWDGLALRAYSPHAQKEHLPSSIPGGQAGKLPPSLIPCSVAIPHYILHQKEKKNKKKQKTNINTSSKTQAVFQTLSRQKPLIETYICMDPDIQVPRGSLLPRTKAAG